MAQNFSLSPQNKNSINSPSAWHKSILHFINIYLLMQTPIQNLGLFIPTNHKQFYSNPRGPICFPDFHTIHCTPHLDSPHCTLYITSINAIHSISTFINFSICTFQIFFLSSTLNFHHPTFTFKITNPNNIFVLPVLCLAILSNSRPSRHESTSTGSWVFWSIARYTIIA